MCGIIATIHKRGDVQFTELAAMQAWLAHRGPDGSGTYTSEDRRVRLAHQRLSLVELGDKGAQPMRKYDRVITFNGEIYNYRALVQELQHKGYVFKSHSDTEVILTAFEAWGIACLHRLNGAFAFVLYDERTKETYVVRDRIGEKPLYYTQTPDTFLFASEIKAFKGLSGVTFEPDIDTIRLNLIFHFFADKEATYFKGIRSVRPGHYLVIRGNTLRDQKYWDVPIGNDPPAHDPDTQITTYVDGISQLLTDAVRIRLSADTPVGSLLSGGLDSSVLTTLAAQISGRNLVAFNLYMEGTPDEDAAAALRLTAAVPNIRLCRTPINNALFSLKNLDAAAWHLEEVPLHKSLYLRKNYSVVRAQGIKAVLNGQGSDEISLGYYNFYEFLRHNPEALQFGSFARYWFESCSFKAYMPETDMRRLIDTNLRRNYLPYTHQDDTVNAVLAFGVKTHLLNILNHEDRFSMAASVECRTAFTDYRIIEKFMSIPSAYKIYDGREKYLVRMVGERLLPPGITDRKKTSFPKFAGEQERHLVRDILHNPSLSASPLLNQVFSRRLFTDIDKLSPSDQWKIAGLYRFEQVFFT